MFGTLKAAEKMRNDWERALHCPYMPITQPSTSLNYLEKPPAPTYQSKVVKSFLLKNGMCQCCDAPDNGQFKCRYCKTTLRWIE